MSMIKHNDIHVWAGDKTGEQARLPEFPYISKEIAYLQELLKTRRGLLIIVRAYRGVGKTTALQILQSALGYDRTEFVVWKTLKSYLNVLRERGLAVDDSLHELVSIYNQLRLSRGHDYVRKLLTQRFSKDAAMNMNQLATSWDYTYAKREANGVMGEIEDIQRMQDAFYKVLIEALSERAKIELFFPILTEKYDNILIDFSDDSVNNHSALNKRIDEMQTLWRTCMEIDSDDGRVNIVFTMQKELFGTHFLEGKATVIDLNPVPSEEIVKLFKKNFETSLFTDEALMSLAKRSRGNIRHFKEYVTSCLIQSGIANIELITDKEVTEWIDVKEFTQRLELQLTEVFPNSAENRELAAQVLDYLESQGEVSQTNIVKHFSVDADPQDDNAMNAARVLYSRLLKALKKYKYIKSRKDGRNNIWSLVSLATEKKE